MKTYTSVKLSNKRKSEVDSLSMTASKIWNSIYGDNFNVAEWNDFLYNLYNTAKKSKKADWLYNCQEMVLNLTR